jgi:hypothetical protein
LELRASCATPGVDGVSGGTSEEGVSNSLGGKGGTWRDGGNPKMSQERDPPSKAKRGGRCNPCTLRTSIGNRMLGILTKYKSAVTASIKESLKPVKSSSEAMSVFRRCDGRGLLRET